MEAAVFFCKTCLEIEMSPEKNFDKGLKSMLSCKQLKL